MAIQAEASPPSRRAKWLAALGFGPKKQARVPEGMRIYTIGDVHGCVSQLDRLHERIESDAASFAGEKVIVYLGDYVDRGPDSRGVIDRLIGSIPKGLSARYVKGNHDQALLDFLGDAEAYRSWRSFGAPETLLSYGVRPPLFDSHEKFEEARQAFQTALPPAHLAFLRRLESTVVLGDYAFVHAGIRPGTNIEDQTDADLLWIRDDFLNCTSAHEKVVVHGHTPISAPVRLHNRIGLDTGAYATGILSCAVLEEAECRFIQVGRD